MKKIIYVAAIAFLALCSACHEEPEYLGGDRNTGDTKKKPLTPKGDNHGARKPAKPIFNAANDSIPADSELQRAHAEIL